MCGIEVQPNLVYNFVDENKFDIVCEKYQKGSLIKMVTIGAASHYKDYFTLLKALVIVNKQNIPFKLTMIGLKAWGHDSIYKDIKDFINKNNISNQIQIIDVLNRNEIPKYLQMNNVFLLTSIAEGLPVSVLEAMASGLTVIATKHGGTEDILTEKTGVLVKIKDFNDIAEKIIDIYNGKLQFDPLIIRKHVVSICGTKAFSERLSSFYLLAIDSN
jgi:glycosyltransferase involved in cell wall biosynthesis